MWTPFVAVRLLFNVTRGQVEVFVWDESGRIRVDAACMQVRRSFRLVVVAVVLRALHLGTATTVIRGQTDAVPAPVFDRTCGRSIFSRWFLGACAMLGEC